MMSRFVSSGVAATVLIAVAPAAAQYIDPDTCSMAEHRCYQARKERDEKNAASEQEQRQMAAARARQARALLKTPPLPAERNGLLGSWRLGDGQRSKIGLGVVTGRGELGEMLEAFKSLDKVGCEIDWGGGITFTPSTYSSGGMPPLVQASGGPIAYRSGRGGAKQVIVAITDYHHMMAFEIASPNRIVDGNGCVLVRVGTPAANAAANATAAPGNARPAAAISAPKVAAAGNAGVVVDGAAFRCGDGSLLHVSLCQGNADDATCKLTELHRGDQIGKLARRADIAARVNGCDAGGIRYGADDKPVFVR